MKNCTIPNTGSAAIESNLVFSIIKTPPSLSFLSSSNDLTLIWDNLFHIITILYCESTCTNYNCRQTNTFFTERICGV